jgi:threonine/homoserine/homoserine lactone efflux protein
LSVELLIKGALSGFAIAAPVGPINVLCIRRTLSDGFGRGLASGLGAAAADTMFGALAAFGVASVLSFLTRWEGMLSLAGGLLLLGIGLHSLRRPPGAGAGRVGTAGLASAFFSTFSLTIANPMTILSFLAVFAGIGIGATSLQAASVLVLGVFLGSAAWWLGLSGLVNAIRHTLADRQLAWINRGAAVAILAFGGYALTRAAHLLAA